jgi:hypothetical protein
VDVTNGNPLRQATLSLSMGPEGERSEGVGSPGGLSTAELSNALQKKHIKPNHIHTPNQII